jgi:eukaryotic-like serine/threonine-protein kinase
LQETIYRAIAWDRKNRHAPAREFLQDLRHQYQVGVAADRLKLKDWRERKSGWPWRILNYAALALIPIVIFSLLLWVAKRARSGGDFGLV